MTVQADGSIAPPGLSAMVICMDEAAKIGACLDALGFCDEVVLVDSGSTDGTLDIARSKGARVFERPFVNTREQKAFAQAQCRGRWILNVDADEIISPELATELSAIVASELPAAHDGYAIPYRNFIGTRWIKHAGYHPDRHVRFALREKSRWVHDVHAVLEVDGSVGRLQACIDHHSYDSLPHLVDKTTRYAWQVADEMHAEGRRAGPLDLIVRPSFRFFRVFILQAGFLEGTLGLLLAAAQSRYVFLKYARLWELGRDGRSRGSTRA